MVDQKCVKCKRTIIRATSLYCYYCWNQERIERGEFKPAKSKFLASMKR